MGATDVALLAGQPWASTAVERTRGAARALERLGAPVRGGRILYGPFDAAGGRDAADVVLSTKPYPDAIFATNDFAAIGAMGAIRDRGLRVPDDILVVGYNDTPLARALPVPLTSISSPMHQMGRDSLTMLVDILGGGAPESLRLQPELMARASTGSPLG